MKFSVRSGGTLLLAAALFMAFAQFRLFSSLPATHNTSRQQQHLNQFGTSLKEERCAIAFFGLPRAFESLVLPSIEQNVIQPNAAYHCDYFVQYYYLTDEPSGRSGGGGHINPDEILQLKQAVLKANTDPKRQPTVAFVMDKEEDFWKQYSPLIHKIRTFNDTQGRFLYYPWKARTYKHPYTTDNIVKMWHSLQSAFQIVETYQEKLNVQYTRVAMLRNDVTYMTPIDIYQTKKGIQDTENRYAVVPGFGRHPVSDRIIYGPYKAVKIWATERFQRLEEHVQSILRNMPGWGMHSEKFVNYTLFPAIRATGTTIVEHDILCFFRARADESVWITDCDGAPGVSLPSIGQNLGSDRKGAVERVLGRPCGQTRRLTYTVTTLDCKRDNQ